MSLIQLNYDYIPMDKALSSTDDGTPDFSLSCFVSVILFDSIPSWISSAQRLLKRFWSPLQCQDSQVLDFDNPKVWAEKKNPDFELSKQQICSSSSSSEKKLYDSSLSRGETAMVMRKLGIVISPEGNKLQERLSSSELSGLFDENEPSLEEVKEAFDVFDENRDGFIDGRELQRILCILGLKEGEELDNCNKMIRAFDENGDGRIDFHEFIKFMENI